MKKNDIINREKLIIENFHKVLAKLITENVPNETWNAPAKPTNNAVTFNDIKQPLLDISKELGLYLFQKNSTPESLRAMVQQNNGNLPQNGVIAIDDDTYFNIIFVLSKDETMRTKVGNAFKGKGFTPVINPTNWDNGIIFSTMRLGKAN